LEFSI